MAIDYKGTKKCATAMAAHFFICNSDYQPGF